MLKALIQLITYFCLSLCSKSKSMLLAVVLLENSQSVFFSLCRSHHKIAAIEKYVLVWQDSNKKHLRKEQACILHALVTHFKKTQHVFTCQKSVSIARYKSDEDKGRQTSDFTDRVNLKNNLALQVQRRVRSSGRKSNAVACLPIKTNWYQRDNLSSNTVCTRASWSFWSLLEPRTSLKLQHAWIILSQK